MAKKEADIGKKLLDPGGMIWNPDAEAADKKAQEKLEEIDREFGAIGLPDLQEIDPERYKDTGTYDPSLVNLEGITDAEDVIYQDGVASTTGRHSVDDTAFSDINLDSRMEDSQMASLSALDDIIAGGGMNAREQADLSRVQSDVAQADRGRRDAIQQQMQSRGMGSSGMSLLSQLDSSQAATDRASQAGLDIEGMAQQRALDAIMQSGSLAGDIRGQEYGEQSDLAAATDGLRRFNASNFIQGDQFDAGQLQDMTKFNKSNTLQNDQLGMQVGQDTKQFNAGVKNTGTLANQGATNESKAFGAQNTQATSNLNTDTTNTNLTRNANLPQQHFGNQITKATGKTGGSLAGVQYYGDQGNAAVQASGEKVGGIAKIGASLYSGGATSAAETAANAKKK